MSANINLSSATLSPISSIGIGADVESSEPCSPSSEGNSYAKDSLLEEDKLEADDEGEVLVRRGHSNAALTTSTPFTKSELRTKEELVTYTIDIDCSGFVAGADSITRTSSQDSVDGKEVDLNEEDPRPLKLRSTSGKSSSASPLPQATAPDAADEGEGLFNEAHEAEAENPETQTPVDKQGRDAAALEREMSPISKLMQRTGYPIVQLGRLRRYGPPPDWAGQSPPRGTEVFVGKIPRDCFEDELVPVLEQAGKIYELRLMADFNGFNRGYAFVVYSTPVEAKKCVKLFNNYEIRKGRLLHVSMSIDNCRLFIGGIPNRVVKDDILKEFEKVTEGVKNVTVYPSASNKTRNRGFAFIEYESHRQAAMAKKQLISNGIQLWGRNVRVAWAEPEIEVDEDIMAEVKVIYVRNLMLSTTEAHLEETFSAIAPVDRVKKVKDHAFVHFQHREGALMAIAKFNGSELDGTTVEVTLAKPVDRDTLALHRQAKRNRSLTQAGMSPIACNLPVADSCRRSSFAPLYGPPLPCGPSDGHNFLTSQGRSKSYTRSRSPSCGSSQDHYMSPLATTQHSLASFMPSFYDSPRGGSGRFECSLYEVDYGHHHPDGVHTYTAIPQTHPQANHKMHKGSPIQLLEELCHLNHWGIPIYTLCTAACPGETVLYNYKVTISALNLPFQPNKLARSIEEAKMTAAEYALAQMGFTLDAPPDVPISPHLPQTTHGPTTIPSHFPYSEGKWAPNSPTGQPLREAATAILPHHTSTTWQ